MEFFSMLGYTTHTSKLNEIDSTLQRLVGTGFVFGGGIHLVRLLTLAIDLQQIPQRDQLHLGSIWLLGFWVFLISFLILLCLHIYK